jgi:hypothetical protein
MMNLTGGCIFGGMQSLPHTRRTNSSKAQYMYILFFTGYGRPVVKKKKDLFWLLLRDRLSTREILRRRNMFLEDYNCVFCASMPVEESVTHLFLHCPFAQACWATLGLIVPHMLDPFDIVVMFRNQLHCLLHWKS